MYIARTREANNEGASVAFQNIIVDYETDNEDGQDVDSGVHGSSVSQRGPSESGSGGFWGPITESDTQE